VCLSNFVRSMNLNNEAHQVQDGLRRHRKQKTPPRSCISDVKNEYSYIYTSRNVVACAGAAGTLHMIFDGAATVNLLAPELLFFNFSTLCI